MCPLDVWLLFQGHQYSPLPALEASSFLLFSSHFFSALCDFFFPVRVFLLQMCVLLFAASQYFSVYPATLGSFQGELYKIKKNSDYVYSTSPLQFQERRVRRHREASDKGVCLHV